MPYGGQREQGTAGSRAEARRAADRRGKEPGRVQQGAGTVSRHESGCRCKRELQMRAWVRVTGTGTCAGDRRRRGLA